VSVVSRKSLLFGSWLLCYIGSASSGPGSAGKMRSENANGGFERQAPHKRMIGIQVKPQMGRILSKMEPPMEMKRRSFGLSNNGSGTPEPSAPPSMNIF
jgi:hypothetical protein